MKIEVNGINVCEINETKENVIKNEISSELFISDMERRVRWVIEHKYEQCFKKLKEEWEPKLSGRVKSIPLDPDEFAELIFSQPDYESRSLKEQRAKEEEHKRRTGQI